MRKPRVHAKIRFRFSVNGRNFKAVGFLKRGESSVSGDEMFSRISREHGGAIGEKGERLIYKHFSELPPELQGYKLVTNRRNRRRPRLVSYFYCVVGRWGRYWDWVDYMGYDNYLVVCSCP